MPKNSTSKNFRMNSEKYTEKLAKYTLFAVISCIIAAICWYFSNILVYILTSVVVSLLARPIMNGLQRISVKGKHLPAWICAVLSIAVILIAVSCVITMVFPIVSAILNIMAARSALVDAMTMQAVKTTRKIRKKRR